MSTMQGTVKQGSDIHFDGSVALIPTEVDGRMCNVVADWRMADAIAEAVTEDDIVIDFEEWQVR